jgi:uncharacterized membrane protein
MEKTYTQIAGRSVERLNALSDGLFAIAMTLIVLDIRVPPHDAVHTEAQLLNALADLAPQIATYLMSFLTLGIFWVGQQTQLEHFKRADRNLSWIQLAFLAAVAALPFTTHLLSEFVSFRAALLVYWGNISVLGLILLVSWTYAEHARLVADDRPPGLSGAILRRIVAAQALYAVGAALCVINTYVSMAVIVALQIFFAVGPRLDVRTAAD